MNKNTQLSIYIIILGIVVAGSIYTLNTDSSSISEIKETVSIQPVTIDDNIQGNPNALITIIEYSDFGCPYCQIFHETMNRVMDRYGKTGEVSWVYRHLPITGASEHSYSAAVSSECVAEYDKSNFWTYTNFIFNDAPDSLTPENLQQLALNLDIPFDFYTECIESNRHNITIDRSIKDGEILSKYESDFKTPYIIISTSEGYLTSISGIESYDNMVEIIETILYK